VADNRWLTLQTQYTTYVHTQYTIYVQTQYTTYVQTQYTTYVQTQYTIYVQTQTHLKVHIHSRRVIVPVLFDVLISLVYLNHTMTTGELVTT